MQKMAESLIKKLIKKRNKDKVLVLSGGGFRGLYTVGVLKGLEELGLDKNIKTVYGVSIGSIIGGLWCSGIKADNILKLFQDLSLDKFYGNEIFTKTGGVLSNKKIEKMINENILDDFVKLQKKLYVGVVDTNSATYKLFDKGDLHKIILGSMAIPGVFPPVKYENNLFVDGGVLNNFPVDLAKEKHPYNEIIGVALNKFEENQKITTSRSNLAVCYDVILNAQIFRRLHYVDYLFYREIPIPTLSLDKKKRKKAFEMGYEDCMKIMKK